MTSNDFLHHMMCKIEKSVVPLATPAKRINTDIKRDFENSSNHIEQALQRHKDADVMNGRGRNYSRVSPVSDESSPKLLVDTVGKKETIMTDKPFKITFRFTSGEDYARFEDKKYRHTFPQGFEQVQFVVDNIKKKDVDINRVRIGISTQPDWSFVVFKFNPSEIAESDFLKKVFGTRFSRDYTVTHGVLKLFTETIIKTCEESTAKANFDWDITLSYKFDKKAFIEAWIKEDKDEFDLWYMISEPSDQQKVDEELWVPVPPPDKFVPSVPVVDTDPRRNSFTFKENMQILIIRLKKWWGQQW